MRRFDLGIPDTDLVRIFVIGALTLSCILLETISISRPINLISTPLFLLPILYAVYSFPRRGLYVAGICALAYQVIGYVSTYPDPEAMIGITGEAVLFIVIAFVFTFFIGKIREGEIRYRTIYEHSQLGILLFDTRTFAIRHPNKKFLAMLNYAEDEMAVTPLAELFYTPREKERFLERLAKETTTSDFETRLTTKSGASCWVNLSWDRIDETTLSCSIVNINSRKLAEKLNNDNMTKYRLLAENTPTSILVLQNGAIRYTNPSFATFLGYPVLESANKDLVTFVEPADQPFFAEFMEERAKKKLGTMAQVFRFVTRNGEVRTGNLLATPIQHLDRPAILVNIIDISEKQRLVEQIQQDNERRRGIIVTVAHELRTPLQPILGYLNLLLSDPDGFAIQDDAKKILERCLVSVDREREIINQMLDLSVLESGKLNLSLAEFPLSPFVQTVLDGGDYAAKAAISVDIDNTIVISADMDRLRNVLDSIFTNAVNYSKPPRKIDIIYHSEPGDNQHHLAIRDNGIGIPANQFDAIFEPFQLADGNTLSRKYDRLGLSLSIVKKILQMHGGDITVESEVGAGSTFTLHLPKGREP